MTGCSLLVGSRVCRLCAVVSRSKAQHAPQRPGQGLRDRRGREPGLELAVAHLRRARRLFRSLCLCCLFPPRRKVRVLIDSLY